MKIAIPSEARMSEFGTLLGAAFRGGETLELVGDVGAGKTTLTKAIAKGLGIHSAIQSPTFTISNRYEARDSLVLAHYDFYRLHDAGLMQNELAEVVEDHRNVTVVEWGDIVADVLPTDRTTISIISTSETARELTITARTEDAEKMFKGIIE